MYQLRALIWKSYKVRIRSPLSTFVDVAGPILFITAYLVLKYILGLHSAPNLPLKTESIFRNSTKSFLNPKQDLSKFICPEVLYYSNPQTQGGLVAQAIQEQCGLSLIPVSDKGSALRQIENGLDERTRYKPPTKMNLNRLNSTSSCLTLPGDNKTIHQIALFLENQTYIELIDTAIATSRVLYQPYTQGSTYDENRLPTSDMNLGLHLLEICLRNALISAQTSQPSSGNLTQDSLPRDLPARANAASIKWRLQAYPVLSSSIILHFIFIVSVLSAILCNATMTLVRTSEANETGLHNHIRLSGVPAGIYWLSQFIVVFIHLTVQSLILAAMLAIPVSNALFDPIHDTSLTMRWVLLLTYSLAINTNGMFIGFLFDRASHTLIASYMLGVDYAMYPFIFTLQSTPYGISSFSPVATVALLNPAANFEALMMKIAAIVAQTGQPFSFYQLNEKLVNGGIHDWSAGQLWLLLVVQIFFWFILTILLDIFYYRSSNSLIDFPLFAINELLCCNSLCSNRNFAVPTLKTSTLKSLPSKKDPNRICCSLRRMSSKGPTIMVAHTKDDPLKMTNEQRKRIQMQNEAVSRAGRFLVNRTQAPDRFMNPAFGSSLDGSMTMESSIHQSIVWKETKVALENLSLDFRFNQVSFILGQTNLKDLLFATLLGLRPLSSGQVTLDDTTYGPMTMAYARPQIGFLGENDIFINELSVFENLQFFGSLREPSYTGYDTESLYVLSLLHLSSRRDTQPSELTSRSARKLALAVAAVGFTKLLLLVEPTLNLRWKPRCQVLNLLKKYKSIRSIVVDTSDIDEATAFGDRIVLLSGGEVNLDGTPDKLSRKLGCGYRLIFESDYRDGRPINQAAIKSLEFFTDKLFKEDKINRLIVTRRSNYQNSLQPGIITESDASLMTLRSSKSDIERLHEIILVLRIRVSPNSTGSLCEILKKFSDQNYLGLRLADLTYESLEDILVHRMSKAIYPHLPPDLLLSLQNRTRQLTIESNDSPPVSVRRISSEIKPPRKYRTRFIATLIRLVQDRLLSYSELASSFIMIAISLLLMSIALVGQMNAVNRGIESKNLMRYYNDPVELVKHTLEYADVERSFKYRTALYLLENERSQRSKTMLDAWIGNRRLSGVIDRNNNMSDIKIVLDYIQKSQDLLTSLIFFKPDTNEATIVYEPHTPHVMLSAISNFQVFHETYINKLPANKMPALSHFIFSQPWYEMIWGYFSRRFIYGFGLIVAEAISIGMFVFAPIRHRSESPFSRTSSSYWFALALCDMGLSSLVAMGYVALFAVFEGFVKTQTMVVFFLGLLLYKFASLPVAYLMSFTLESGRKAFFFVFLIQFTTGWIFGIHLRTFVEWTLIDQGYLHAIAMWIVLFFPVTSLIDLIVNISQLNRMQQLCSQVPAFSVTSNLVNLESIQRPTIVDKLIDKVHECLSSGKTEVKYDILHQNYFGVVWNIYLLCLFGIVAWTFLLTSERFFGFIVRKFTSARLATDPLKTLVRYSESGTRTYKWDREKDRLVNEYIRCMGDLKYVETMSKNCIYLRIWLKPMSDQNLLDKRLNSVLEPLFAMGQPKNDVQLELKTTLQLFIRIGNETNRYKVDKVQLIETYTRYVKTHTGSVLNFAIVDWSCEALYRILLHGHYNIRATSFYD